MIPYWALSVGPGIKGLCFLNMEDDEIAVIDVMRIGNLLDAASVDWETHDVTAKALSTQGAPWQGSSKGINKEY